MFVSPQQQVAVTGDPGTAQDALHDAYASIALGERCFVVAAGEMYRIGPDPVPGQHFGLGYGGATWHITWPDGTAQTTRNLWHWGRVDRPDNAVLMHGPFWGSNLGIAQREHLLQAPPLHLRARYIEFFPSGFYGILDEREDWHVTSKRKLAEWNARYNRDPLLRLLRYRMGGWRHVVLTRRLGRTLRRFVTKNIICLTCWHRPGEHWVAGDDEMGDVDWGCHHAHRDRKTGKRIHCRC